jgi:hypothetical protein
MHALLCGVTADGLRQWAFRDKGGCKFIWDRYISQPYLWCRPLCDISKIRESGYVTPHVTKILIKLFKMQLSLKAREDQVVEVSNQNLNYQDFKFEVSKCCLVWTDTLSQQIFRID